MNHPRRSAVLLTLVVLSSCDDETGEPAPVGPAPADEYCERIAAAYCDFYVRCERVAASSKQECLAIFAETCEARYEPRYVALEALGMVTLQREGIDTCAAHLAAVQCDQQVSDLAGACGGLWRGEAPVGAACSVDVESLVCSPGSTCVLDLSLCGVCQPASAPGGSCEGDLACDPRAYCTGGICVARTEVGQTCTPNDRCVLGASCLGGVCVGRRYAKVGESCLDGTRCVYGAACVGGSCVKTSLLGAACSPQSPCENGSCIGELCEPLLPPSSACSDSGQCAALGCVQGACGGWLTGCL